MSRIIGRGWLGILLSEIDKGQPQRAELFSLEGTGDDGKGIE